MVQWIIFAFIILFVLKQFLPIKGVENITVQEAKDRVSNKKVQFIDVRTAGEYNAYHQNPFKNIPIQQLRSTDKLDKTKEVVVICQSGMRSRKAAQILKKQGFESIYNVKGGMAAW